MYPASMQELSNGYSAEITCSISPKQPLTAATCSCNSLLSSVSHAASTPICCLCPDRELGAPGEFWCCLLLEESVQGLAS